jgi:hypothetical protein
MRRTRTLVLISLLLPLPTVRNSKVKRNVFFCDSSWKLIAVRITRTRGRSGRTYNPRAKASIQDPRHHYAAARNGVRIVMSRIARLNSP